MFRLRWGAICRGTKVHRSRMKSVGLRINSGFCKHDFLKRENSAIVWFLESLLKWSLLGLYKAHIQKIWPIFSHIVHCFQEIWKTLHWACKCPFDPSCEDHEVRPALQLQGIQLCQHQSQGLHPCWISGGPNGHMPLGCVQVYPVWRRSLSLSISIVCCRVWGVPWTFSRIFLYDNLGWIKKPRDMGIADKKYSQQVKTVDLMACAGYKKVGSWLFFAQ